MCQDDDTGDLVPIGVGLSDEVRYIALSEVFVKPRLQSPVNTGSRPHVEHRWVVFSVVLSSIFEYQ